MATIAQIALGSNLGDRKAQLDAAVAALDKTTGIRVLKVSIYHETPPVGGPDGQGAFLNAAASLETSLEPLELLSVLQDLEHRAGRVKTVRWGERPLDLDLLLFGTEVLRIPSGREGNALAPMDLLVVPHPRMAVRRFVLTPLAEIAPDAKDPLTGKTAAELLSSLDRRPSYLAIHDPFARFSRPLCARLVRVLSAILIAPGPSSSADGWNMPGPQTHDEESERRFLLGFEHHSRELRADRWSTQAEGERWLISDFWFDAIVEARQVSEGERPAFRERFFTARRAIIAPTFVVAARGDGHRWTRASSHVDPYPPLGDTPILEITPGDPEAMTTEVLAACNATRAFG